MGELADIDKIASAVCKKLNWQRAWQWIVKWVVIIAAIIAAFFSTTCYIGNAASEPKEAAQQRYEVAAKRQEINPSFWHNFKKNDALIRRTINQIANPEETIGDALDKAGEKMTLAAGGAADSLAKAGETALEKTVETSKDIIGTIANGASNAWDATKELTDDATKKVKELLKKP